MEFIFKHATPIILAVLLFIGVLFGFGVSILSEKTARPPTCAIRVADLFKGTGDKFEIYQDCLDDEMKSRYTDSAVWFDEMIRRQAIPPAEDIELGWSEPDRNNNWIVVYIIVTPSEDGKDKFYRMIMFLNNEGKVSAVAI